MNQDQAATTLDPEAILEAAAEDARRAAANGDPGPIETLLDLEERVVFDLVERHVPQGDVAVADARTRHLAILRALTDGDVTDDASELVADHVDRSGNELDTPLLAHLDAAGREDLAAALEEARLSRQEADVELRPTEAAGAQQASD